MIKKIFVFIFILLIVIFVIYIVIIEQKVDYNKSEKNPYELNLDSLNNIDNTKICYNEINEISVNLNYPSGIAIGIDDKIYVTGDSSLLVIDKSSNLILRKKINKPTRCLAISKDNKIYLAVTNHIEVFSNDCRNLAIWKPQNDSSVITSIALKDNIAYVADGQLNFVYKYNLYGKLLKTIGSSDTTDETSRFIIPSYYFDIALDPEGFLWVVNPGRHILVSFNDKEEIRSYWGNASASLEGFCGCCNPTHIAILDDGSFITSEKGIVRVKKYNPSGEFNCAIAGSEKFVKNSKGLDIAVDSKQNIYVLEPEAQLIHVFSKK